METPQEELASEKIKNTCDWNGQYAKDNNKNLSFWCVYCGKERGLEQLRVIKCPKLNNSN